MFCYVSLKIDVFYIHIDNFAIKRFKEYFIHLIMVQRIEKDQDLYKIIDKLQLIVMILLLKVFRFKL